MGEHCPGCLSRLYHSGECAEGYCRQCGIWWRDTLTAEEVAKINAAAPAEQLDVGDEDWQEAAKACREYADELEFDGSPGASNDWRKYYWAIRKLAAERAEWQQKAEAGDESHRVAMDQLHQQLHKAEARVAELEAETERLKARIRELEVRCPDCGHVQLKGLSSLCGVCGQPVWASNDEAAEQPDLVRVPQLPDDEGERPSLKAYSVSREGDQWCALVGPNLQEGVAGFGDTPTAAQIALACALAAERDDLATQLEARDAVEDAFESNVRNLRERTEVAEKHENRALQNNQRWRRRARDATQHAEARVEAVEKQLRAERERYQREANKIIRDAEARVAELAAQLSDVKRRAVILPFYQGWTACLRKVADHIEACPDYRHSTWIELRSLAKAIEDQWSEADLRPRADAPESALEPEPPDVGEQAPTEAEGECPWWSRPLVGADLCRLDIPGFSECRCSGYRQRLRCPRRVLGSRLRALTAKRAEWQQKAEAGDESHRVAMDQLHQQLHKAEARVAELEAETERIQGLLKRAVWFLPERHSREECVDTLRGTAYQCRGVVPVDTQQLYEIADAIGQAGEPEVAPQPEPVPGADREQVLDALRAACTHFAREESKEQAISDQAIDTATHDAHLDLAGIACGRLVALKAHAARIRSQPEGVFVTWDRWDQAVRWSMNEHIGSEKWYILRYFSGLLGVSDQWCKQLETYRRSPTEPPDADAVADTAETATEEATE